MRALKFLQSRPFAHKFAAIVTSITAVIIIANTALCVQRANDQQQQQQAQYGNQMASQAAYMASNLMLSDSRIGLRVLTSKTLKQAKAQYVSIHDNNNTVLAEAGENTDEGSYRANIRLQDNIAGYLDIEFARPAKLQHSWAPWIINVLILALIYLLSYLVANKVFNTIDLLLSRLLNSHNSSLAKLPRSILTADFIDRHSSDTNGNAQLPAQGVLLAIRFTNRRGEPLQLDRADDRALLLDNLNIIDKVVKLYGGHHQSAHEGEIVSFPRSEDDSFQALCAAVLMRGLFEKSSNPDDHSDIALALILPPVIGAIAEQLHPQYLQQLQAGALAKANQLGEIVLSRLLLTEATIAERTRVNSGHNDIYTLISISPVYQKLLDNQISQLSSPDEDSK